MNLRLSSLPFPLPSPIYLKEKVPGLGRYHTAHQKRINYVRNCKGCHVRILNPGRPTFHDSMDSLRKPVTLLKIKEDMTIIAAVETLAFLESVKLVSSLGYYPFFVTSKQVPSQHVKNMKTGNILILFLFPTDPAFSLQYQLDQIVLYI